MKSKADASQHFVPSFLSVCGFSVKWFHFHAEKQLGGTHIKHLFLDLKCIMASNSQTEAEEPILIESYNSLGWKGTLKVLQQNLLLYSKAPVWNYFLLKVVNSVLPAKVLNCSPSSSFPSTRWEEHLNLTLASQTFPENTIRSWSISQEPHILPIFQREKCPHGNSQSNSAIGKHLHHIFKYWDKKKKAFLHKFYQVPTAQFR